MKLRIIATGGTFDKHYDEIAGRLSFGSGHMAQVIQRSRMTVPTVLEELPFLDSLEMQAEDRQRILRACQDSAESHIVIIHGTDTMAQTGAVLGAAGLDKTVVLTGAMIPYQIADSDALFNFGFACGVAQLLGSGIYVAMNGQVFPWDQVQKNRLAGVFEKT